MAPTLYSQRKRRSDAFDDSNMASFKTKKSNIGPQPACSILPNRLVNILARLLPLKFESWAQKNRQMSHVKVLSFFIRST